MGFVYDQYVDTVGRFHYTDTETGTHIISDVDPSSTGVAKSETINPPKMYGWICPVCGRGLSPYINVCPCRVSDKGWEITYK